MKIVPDNSICYINAPDIDSDSAILKLLTPTTQYDWSINLSLDNKKILTSIITTDSIQDYFHRLNIKSANSLWCESYDGMCTVILSDSLDIPEWFTEKYAKEGLCWNIK